MAHFTGSRWYGGLPFDADPVTKLHMTSLRGYEMGGPMPACTKEPLSWVDTAKGREVLSTKLRTKNVVWSPSHMKYYTHINHCAPQWLNNLRRDEALPSHGTLFQSTLNEMQAQMTAVKKRRPIWDFRRSVDRDTPPVGPTENSIYSVSDKTYNDPRPTYEKDHRDQRELLDGTFELFLQTALREVFPSKKRAKRKPTATKTQIDSITGQIREVTLDNDEISIVSETTDSPRSDDGRLRECDEDLSHHLRDSVESETNLDEAFYEGSPSPHEASQDAPPTDKPKKGKKKVQSKKPKKEEEEPSKPDTWDPFFCDRPRRKVQIEKVPKSVFMRNRRKAIKKAEEFEMKCGIKETKKDSPLDITDTMNSRMVKRRSLNFMVSESLYTQEMEQRAKERQRRVQLEMEEAELQEKLRKSGHTSKVPQYMNVSNETTTFDMSMVKESIIERAKKDYEIWSEENIPALALEAQARRQAELGPISAENMLPEVPKGLYNVEHRKNAWEKSAKMRAEIVRKAAEEERLAKLNARRKRGQRDKEKEKVEDVRLTTKQKKMVQEAAERLGITDIAQLTKIVLFGDPSRDVSEIASSPRRRRVAMDIRPKKSKKELEVLTEQKQIEDLKAKVDLAGSPCPKKKHVITPGDVMEMVRKTYHNDMMENGESRPKKAVRPQTAA